MTKFGFALYFFIWASRRGLGGDASKRRKIVSTTHRCETLSPPAAPSGFPLQCFWPSVSVRAYAIRPYKHHMYGCIAYALMSKNISTSIPLALPSATSPRFAANHPIPSPAPFSRAANPASGSSLKTIRTLPASGYRYATADAVGRGSEFFWPCGSESL